MFDLSDVQIQWILIAIYMSFIFIIGVMKTKKIKNTDDFLVGGRNIGWFLIFTSLGATFIGGGASIGATGKTYSWGLFMTIASFAWYLQLVFSGIVIAPKFREAKLYTVAGYLGYRFGDNPRIVGLVLSLLFSIFILAAQMAAFGTIISTLFQGQEDIEITIKLTILIGGIIVIVYSTLGGLFAVVYTDLFQFVILIIGFMITLFFCVPDIFDNWTEVTAKVPDYFFKIQGEKGYVILITTFLAFFLGETFGPAYVTRFCAGKDIRQTKIGIAGAGIFLMIIFPITIFFIALYAKFNFPNIPDSQQVLPIVIQSLNHPIVAGLILAALLSAIMSSADSALNSATAIFVKDLFEDQLKLKFKSQKKMLLTARISSASLGIVAVLVAVLWTDIIELLLFTYQIWAPGIIMPIVYGVLSKNKSKEVTTAIFITMVFSVVVSFIYSYTDYSKDFDPAIFGVVVSIICFVIIRLIMWRKTTAYTYSKKA